MRNACAKNLLNWKDKRLVKISASKVTEVKNTVKNYEFIIESPKTVLEWDFWDEEYYPVKKNLHRVQIIARDQQQAEDKMKTYYPDIKFHFIGTN